MIHCQQLNLTMVVQLDLHSFAAQIIHRRINVSACIKWTWNSREKVHSLFKDTIYGLVSSPVQLCSVNMVWIFVFHYRCTRHRCRKPVDCIQFTFSYTASAFEINNNLILLWKSGCVFIPATSCYLKSALTGGLCKYRAVGTRHWIWKAAQRSDLRIHSRLAAAR